MKFNLPEDTGLDDGLAEPCCHGEINRDPYKYIRRVSVPVNDEILKATPVKTEVTVILKGVVCSADDDTHYDGEQIKVNVKSVEVKANNEFTEIVEDD